MPRSVSETSRCHRCPYCRDDRALQEDGMLSSASKDAHFGLAVGARNNSPSSCVLHQNLGWRPPQHFGAVLRVNRDLDSLVVRITPRPFPAPRSGGRTRCCRGDLESAPTAEHSSCRALSNARYQAIYDDLDMDVSFR